MNDRRGMLLTGATAALAIASFIVIVMSPAVAYACGQGSSPHVQREPDKPVIKFAELTGEQKSQLKAYAADATAMLAAVDEDLRASGNAEGDKAQRRRTVEAANERVKRQLSDFGDRLPFRTTMVVGNGMLCGARIEILVPAPAEDIEVSGGSNVWIKGKGRDGTSTEGTLYDALGQLSRLP